MCELLGLNFNKPVHPSLSFRGFRGRDKGNPDGWGIARFDGRACQVFKEPVAASQSTLAAFLGHYDPFASKIFIAHVRDASRGGRTLQNTHPFSRVFRGREIALAHNGTLDRVMDRSELKFHPVGETDSEYLFCALLTVLARRCIELADFEAVQVVLRDFNRFGTMNLLFSEGEHLFSYRDQDGYNGLCLVERSAPFDRVSLQDDDWEVDLAEEKRPEQQGFVIATHPLTDEPWGDLSPGCLAVFRDGERIYGA